MEYKMTIDEDYNQYEMCRLVNVAMADAVKFYNSRRDEITPEMVREWEGVVNAGCGADAAFQGDGRVITEESVYQESYASKMLEMLKKEQA